MEQMYIATDFSTDKRDAAGLWYDSKIGFTNNVDKRLSQLQTSRPNLCIVWATETTRKQELQLHRALAAGAPATVAHHSREWYWMHEDVFTMHPEGFVLLSAGFRQLITGMLYE